MTVLLWHSMLALCAGILLNAAPCVLPVIPFKVQAVMRDIGHSWPHRLTAAGAMWAGSLGFFLILGGATVFMGLTWGAMFQSKIFIALLSLFLLGAGLVTLMGWSVPLPQWVHSIKGQRYSGAALTGLLSGVLATPCGGPFLGAVLAYALTQPPLISMVVFSSIGTGLVLPYIALLTVPGLARRAFNTGAWTIQIKQLLGFVLIGAAIFFSQSLVSSTISGTLWILLPVAFTGWVLAHLVQGRNWRQRAIPMLAATVCAGSATAYFLAPSAPELDWHPYSLEAISKTRAFQQPVMLEFTAEWCLNCKVLEKTTYADQRVVDAARKANIVALRVDMTQMKEPEQRLLVKYGGRALPFLLLFDDQGRVRKQFRGMFGAQTLADALEQLTAKNTLPST